MVSFLICWIYKFVFMDDEGKIILSVCYVDKCSKLSGRYLV